MNIKLTIKPLSVNACFQGRRFKTSVCKAYDASLQRMLRGYPPVVAEKYEVRFRFGLKNCSRTDSDNCVKILQDNLVAAGIISDDRHIYRHVIEKYQSAIDTIEIDVLPLN